MMSLVTVGYHGCMTHSFIIRCKCGFVDGRNCVLMCLEYSQMFSGCHAVLINSCDN